MNTRVLYALLCGLVLLRVAGPVAAEQSLPSFHEQADKILVLKAERKLHLLKAGRVLRTFDISLGLAPVGPKQREGDYRTPEGVYHVETRNPSSDYFLSIKVSYPDAADRARAQAKGVDPGGQIMIHGLPNQAKYETQRYRGWDWTDGCIAVSNSDMVEIWLLTQNDIPIDILP